MGTALSTFPTHWQFVGTGGANGSGNTFTPLGLLTPNVPQGRRDGQAQIIDDLSFVIGTHTLKFGVNFRRNRLTDLSSGKADRGRGVCFLLRPGVCSRGIGLWLQLFRAAIQRLHGRSFPPLQSRLLCRSEEHTSEL